MHTGSSTALFPIKGYRATGLEGNLVLPNDRQRQIHTLFVRYAGEVSKARRGKRLIVVNLGDSVDGFHHGSLQESLFREQDQRDAHVLLMQDFMRRVGYGKGDELYYVKGTETHVKDIEEGIAQELGAVKTGDGLHINTILQLNVNGTNHLFYHHGKGRGEGDNEGNSLRNCLRNMRTNRRKDGLERIDFSWSGHTHAHTYNTHIDRERGNFHVLHGVICPSWQSKTRYALEKVPLAVNSVGGVFVDVSVDGRIGMPNFVVEVTRDL